jgi:hypothetical protein
MAIILDRPGFGAQLGTSLGGGLGKAFEALAEDKLKQMRQAQQAEQLQKSGLPEVLAYLDPQVQAQYVRGAQAADIEAQKEAGLSSLLERVLGTGEGAQPAAPQQQDQVQSLLQQLQQPGGLAQAQLGKRLEQPQIGRDKIPFSEPSERVNITREKQLSDEINKLESALRDPKLAGVEKGALRNQINERRKEFRELSKELRKESKAELKEMRNKAASSSDRLKSLERLETLEDEGLIEAGYNELLNRSGYNIQALRNPASDEAQAIIQSFARDAKTFFGGRVSNFEVEQFMRALPSLSQTPEGRKRVISRMKDFARLEQATYKEARDIISKNANIPPADLWERVDDRLDKQRDKFAQLLKKDLSRKVPEAPSKLKTAALSAVGDIIGKGPGVAKGAIKGATLGYGFTRNPYGAGLGALLGSLGVI